MTRRSHDSGEERQVLPDDGAEEQRRTSSSDATPRQTASTTRFIGSTTHNDQSHSQDSSKSVLSSDIFSASTKRLNFFADKFSSSSQKSTNNFLHPQITPRADSLFATQLSSSPTSATINMTSAVKSHTSPSKASYGRTYDSKLVSKEMQRLGNLSQLPAGVAPPLASAPSTGSLSISAPTLSQASHSTAPSTEPWKALHVELLPLFNGEPLISPIEELNSLVKRHIQSVVSSSPSKALSTLENDATELISLGMVTLNAKLMGIDDEKLIGRVVELWRFFWDQVLTYVEGVLLPLQTDPLLSKLYRTPKSHRNTSPTRQASKSSISTSTIFFSSPTVDIRTLALRAFRDKVIHPLFSRLFNQLALMMRQEAYVDTADNQRPRLQQMLLVLSSHGQYQPSTFSLATPAPQYTSGEAAIAELLRIVRAPMIPQTIKGQTAPLTRNPTFLAGALPRDRRGRVARKSKRPVPIISNEDSEGFGDETPRNGPSSVMADAEREQELLDALKSPDLESVNKRVGTAGWALRTETLENTRMVDDEDDDLNWGSQITPATADRTFIPQPDRQRRLT